LLNWKKLEYSIEIQFQHLEKQCEVVHETQQKQHCNNVPERKCRTVTQTVIDNLVETKFEQQCRDSFTTECDTVVVTKIEAVPGEVFLFKKSKWYENITFFQTVNALL